MSREELSKLISDVAADLSRGKEVWTASDLADAILTALDEAGFQCVKWLTTEELEASTVPAGYQIWTSSIYCDRSRDRHMIIASPYRKDEK